MKKQIISFVKDDCSGLRMLDRELFLQFLSDFGAGCKLKLTVEHYFPQRSLKQNGTIHWWFDLLAEECGLSPARMKEILCYKYLRRPALDNKGEEIVDDNTGEVAWYVKSTADLDKAEMVIFMDEIWLWALYNRNLELPKPDENYKINFQEEHKKKLINK